MKRRAPVGMAPLALCLAAVVARIESTSTMNLTSKMHHTANADKMPQHGFMNQNLATGWASITWCLNQTTDADCGEARRGRTTFTLDLCAIDALVDLGNMSLSNALRGQIVDLLLVPEEDETIWVDNGVDPSGFAGLVGDVLTDVAIRGGFQWHAYVVRAPKAGDAYDGNWNTWILDWTNRVDIIGAWMFDNPTRRAVGIEYPFNFYALDAIVVVVDRGGRQRSIFEMNWFAWIQPFKVSLWMAIMVTVILVGITERFVEGHLASSLDTRVKHISRTKFEKKGGASRRLRAAAQKVLVSHGKLSYSLEWSPTELGLLSAKGKKLEAFSRASLPGTLYINIHSASGLTGVDKLKGGEMTSDPYVCLSAANGGRLPVMVGASERPQTPVTRRTLNPVWVTDADFEFNGSLNALIDMGVQLEVFDFDPFFAHRKLGECVAPLDTLLTRTEDAAVITSTLTLAERGAFDDAKQQDYLRVATAHRAWLQGITLLHGIFLGMISLMDGSGYFGLVQAKTFSGRLCTLAWQLGCCLFLASYTANLAQVLVSANLPQADLSATDFESLRINSRPVCLRDGTAISSIIAQMLSPASIRIQPGGLIASQDAAANALRDGTCDGFVQPLWMAQDMLLRASNAPCDLRLVYPTVMLASGGYVAATPFHRRGGSAGAQYTCTGVLTHSIGLQLQETTARLLSGIRAEQGLRLKNNTCLADGTSGALAADGADGADGGTSLGFTHFLGLFLIIFGLLVISLLFSNPMQALLSQLYQRCVTTAVYVAEEATETVSELSTVDRKETSSLAKGTSTSSTMSRMNRARIVAIQRASAARKRANKVRRMVTDLAEPPPTTDEWRESVDVRLVTMEYSLGDMREKLERMLTHIEGGAGEAELKRRDFSMSPAAADAQQIELIGVARKQGSKEEEEAPPPAATTDVLDVNVSLEGGSSEAEPLREPLGAEQSEMWLYTPAE